MKKPEIGHYYLKDQLVPYVKGVYTAEAYEEMIDALMFARGIFECVQQVHGGLHNDDFEKLDKALQKAGVEL